MWRNTPFGKQHTFQSSGLHMLKLANQLHELELTNPAWPAHKFVTCVSKRNFVFHSGFRTCCFKQTDQSPVASSKSEKGFHLLEHESNITNITMCVQHNNDEFKKPQLPSENVITYFRCYAVRVVELLNYYTNHCTYIKFIKFTH